MDKKAISCAFNIDAACVEVKFADGDLSRKCIRKA